MGPGDPETPNGAAQPGGADSGGYPGHTGATTGRPDAGTTSHLRQRVIVVSPFGRHQVDLPADLPVAGFLPDLLAGVGLYPRKDGQGGLGWQLQAADGRVLAPDATLPAQGIPPGAVLWLRGGARASANQAGGYQTDGHQAGWPQSAGPQATGPPATGYPATGPEGTGQQDGQQDGGQPSGPPATGYPATGDQPAGHQAAGHQGDYHGGGHQPTGYPGPGRQGGSHQPSWNQAGVRRGGGHRAARGRGARPTRPGQAPSATGRGAVPPGAGPGQAPPPASGPGAEPPTWPGQASSPAYGQGAEPPAAGPGQALPGGWGAEPPAGSPAGPDQPRWPSRTPLPPATPLPADDGLTPLQRTEAVLPSPVPRTRRLMAAAEMLLKRPQSPEGVIAVGPGTPQPVPGRDWQEGELVSQEAAEAAEAAEPAGPLHLIPTDLTVAAAPTRAERVRAVWRDSDHLGQLDARIAKPRLHRCATVAVVSPKGGVGKTTVVALLGTLFSLLRRDPVVAVDTNPDFGSLGRVLTPDQSWYVDDLARLVAEHDELSLTALESRLGRAVHGLLVVPAPTDPVRMAALDERAYRQVITRLKDFFSVILLDCGTGLQDPASAAAIAAADHVVLVTDAQPATASLVAESATLLLHSGRPMSVVVNRMPARGTGLDLVRLSQYIPAARGLVVVPDEISAAARLATGSFHWRDAPPSWQRALRELAVVVTADWQRLGLAR